MVKRGELCWSGAEMMRERLERRQPCAFEARPGAYCDSDSLSPCSATVLPPIHYTYIQYYTYGARGILATVLS